MTRTLEANIDGRPVKLTAHARPLWWQTQGRQYTASGYGRRIPTEWMVQLPGSTRWRRVYVCCFSNSGTAYIDGPRGADGKRAWIVITG